MQTFSINRCIYFLLNCGLAFWNICLYGQTSSININRSLGYNMSWLMRYFCEILKNRLLIFCHIDLYFMYYYHLKSVKKILKLPLSDFLMLIYFNICTISLKVKIFKSNSSKDCFNDLLFVKVNLKYFISVLPSINIRKNN